MVGYLPIQVRLNPVKKMFFIQIEDDEIYKSIEFQYLESFERGKGYRVLAIKKDETVDVYNDEALIRDKNEDFSSFFKKLNKIYTVEFEHPKMEILNDILNVHIEFADCTKRNIVFNVEENVKKSEGIDLFDNKGYHLDQPEFLPLSFNYNMNCLNKKAKYNFLINYKKTKVSKTINDYPYADFGIRYSLEMQVIEFGINEEIEMIDLSHDLTTNGFKYVFKDERLTEISLIDEKIPFKIIFDPGLPQKVGSGKFVINAFRNMGKIVGTYNNLVNGKKVKGQMKLGRWNPNIKNTKGIANEKSIYRIWPTYYELSKMIDLEQLEYTGKWLNNKGAQDEEIY